MAVSSTLGAIIAGTAEAHGLPLKDLTVLSSSRDPYRLDTPASHAKAQWMLDNYTALHEGGRIYLRGLHYKFVGRATMPDDAEPLIGEEDERGDPIIDTFEPWEDNTQNLYDRKHY